MHSQRMLFVSGGNGAAFVGMFLIVKSGCAASRKAPEL
jgi:hypothetical protein